MASRQSVSTVKQTLNDFMEDDCMSLAGALAFYTVLALAPLLVIFLKVAAMLGPDTQAKLVGKVQEVVGPQAGESLQAIIQSAAQQPGWGSVAGAISLLMLLFSASGIFAQLQLSLNKIWDVEPKKSQGAKGWLRKRLVAISMIVALALVLIASVVANAVVSMLVADGGTIWKVANALVSLAVFIVLFAVIYKYLPDVKVRWRDVWIGATVTAILFAVGRVLIGLYLGKSSVASPYGAAGSLLLLLLFIYYSSLLIFLGAEFTQVHAKISGNPIEPDEYAQREPHPKGLNPA